ncbi:retrotransposon protein putative unclassified, partial [Trifolium medium]|nr:retrotransposon protein putative unclassified [Trifolium medium]
QKASWVLKKGCFWFVGNGSDINIWEDRWIHPHVGSKIWTPKPENTSLHKVKDLINPQTLQWQEDTINQCFYPIEAAQICQIPLTNTMDEDIISWQGTKDGNYIVKYGYHAIMEWNSANSNNAQPSNHNENNDSWSNLWKLSNPPKQLHLIWRILHKAIPVKTNLMSKGIICDSLCPRRNQGPETIDHIFLHCEWARQVWFSSPLTITTTNSHTQSFSDWFNYMQRNTTQDCIQIITTITYSIWLARNNKIFQNKDTPVNIAIDCALKILRDYQHNITLTRHESTVSQPSIACNNKSWSPPPRSYLKLNVDAHLLDDGHWGLGLVLRREDGRCVGAATKLHKGSDSVGLAETMGLQEGLNFINSMQ